SYRVNEKTGDPVKYLKDQKGTLQRKFFGLYPSGMKRTTFLTCLNDGSFVYKGDMGNQLIAKLESIQHHLKHEYDKEPKADFLGHTYHVECLEHYLPYAFGQ
ncbi:8543_t:CDS:2, partial [Entrophospora sp. SA101]